MPSDENILSKKKPAHKNPAPTVNKSRLPPTSVADSPLKQLRKTPGVSTGTLLSLLIFFATFLVYANTLKNGYAMDDIEVLQRNSFVVKGFDGISELLATPHLLGYMITPNETYRPLSMVTFAIEYQFWGANPVVGHFFNILLYAFGAILLFRFLSRLFNGEKDAVAFITALLFIIHPLHTEVVANIKSCDELLCFLFGFVALHQFMNYADHNKPINLLIGVFTLFLSIISKETTITFLGVVPLVFFFMYNKSNKRSSIIMAGTIVAMVAFLMIRAWVLKINNNQLAPINMMDNALAGAPNMAARFATALFVLGKYLKLLILPYPLSIDYSFNSIPYVTFSNIWVLVTLAGYLAIGGTAVYRITKNKKDPWALGILFFVITLSLFSNLFFLIGSGMSERFLFFPSVGFCLIVALALEKWVARAENMQVAALKSRNIILILLPILVLYTSITVARNEEWTDSETLFEADLKKVPDNARLNYCVGYAYVTGKYENEKDPTAKKRILEQGIAYLKKSVAISPDYCNAQTELGDAYFINQQYDSAEIHDVKALKINPKASEVMNNLAGVYFVTHQFRKALDLCQQAVIIRPKYAQAYYNIGLCYNNLQQFDSSIVFLKKALELDPAFNQSNEMLAKDYRAVHQEDSAKKYESIHKATVVGKTK